MKEPEEGGPAPAITRTSAIYERLRREIIQGTLLPGEKLRIEALRTRYNVGGTPLREAMNRLSTEGLVAQSEQRGFRVTPVSADERDEVDALDLELPHSNPRSCSTSLDLYSLRRRVPHGTRSTRVWTTRTLRILSRIASARAG